MDLMTRGPLSSERFPGRDAILNSSAVAQKDQKWLHAVTQDWDDVGDGKIGDRLLMNNVRTELFDMETLRGKGNHKG